ncbi:MAG: hypothetical protein ACYC6Y_06290 [Thermoguttaceae bacterium]
MRTSLWVWVVMVWASCAAASETLWSGFVKAPQFDEQICWRRLESGVRVLIDAPQAPRAARRVLVVYATPNGNTVEQTWGCAATVGRDWHFDIQHVAAQIRRLREIDKSTDYVLAVVQAPKLSWPSFRADRRQSGAIIRGLVESLAAESSAGSVILAGHSGGGSFLWGYLNAVDAIGPSVERIVLLDANYSYSDQEGHGDKVLAWLQKGATRRLVVIAYDDREITLDGKKVVGADGGTFRATERMLARLRRDVEMTEGERGTFRHITGMDGRVEFFVHPNPENKILHTALVGEMNGLLEGLTVGTELEGKWGQFGGPRSYTAWVQAEPWGEPERSPASIPADVPEARLRLPERPDDAPGGSQFFERVAGLGLEDREAAVVREILGGNVPDFFRRLKPVALEALDGMGQRHRAVCFVTADYAAVGTDGDFFRFPLSPRAAMAIADGLGCTLMTARISDAVHARADLKLSPIPLTEDRETIATFYRHHQLIEAQRSGKPVGLLVSGIKKDLVWTGRLAEKPHKVAIYGWHYASGEPIQPLYAGHWDRYVDYSHGLRLVAGEALVDGKACQVVDVLKDPQLWGLFSGEGPLDVAALRRSAGWDR